MESSLVNNLLAPSAVPSHLVERRGRTSLLDYEADRVGEADGIVGCVAGEEEHVALADDDVFELAIVDDLEHHGALVLVEVFGSLVDVVVCSGVGPANNLFV